MVQIQVNTSADHCEKNRMRFSQWSVVITFASPYGCDIRCDHCEKNVRASPDFSRRSGWSPNETFVEPCRKNSWHCTPLCQISKKCGTGVPNHNPIPVNNLHCLRDPCATFCT